LDKEPLLAANTGGRDTAQAKPNQSARQNKKEGELSEAAGRLPKK